MSASDDNFLFGLQGGFLFGRMNVWRDNAQRHQGQRNVQSLFAEHAEHHP
ncbi:MAG: hypothetical protein WCK47_02445 [bacterium]|nr:hypothetical protein [Candidatus Sumerlaeota bacterium]